MISSHRARKSDGSGQSTPCHHQLKHMIDVLSFISVQVQTRVRVVFTFMNGHAINMTAFTLPILHANQCESPTTQLLTATQQLREPNLPSETNSNNYYFFYFLYTGQRK